MLRSSRILPMIASSLLFVVVAGCTAAKAPGLVPQTTENPTPVMPPPPPPPAPPTAHLVFVGDLMLDRTPGAAIARGEDPFASFASTLKQADLAVGNLECVIATVGSKVPKGYNFRCHPRNVPLLARYFGAVSVANNHSGDFGKDAFAEQLGLLKQGGVPYFGGGQNSKEAHAPLILQRNGIRLALLAYNEVELRSYEAGSNTPGLAWGEDAQALADIAVARQQADLVIVYPHWGLEYHKQPSERQRSFARKMIDAGADMIVGAHPHVTETVEYYKGKLILYSLGNFVFDDFLDVPAELNEPSRTSWVLRVTVDQKGLLSWDTQVARTDDTGFPRPVRGVASPCGSSESTEIRSCHAE